MPGAHAQSQDENAFRIHKEPGKLETRKWKLEIGNWKSGLDGRRSMVSLELSVRFGAVRRNSGGVGFMVLFSIFEFPFSNFRLSLEFADQQHGVEPAESKGI
jgi:hypothetical protein